MTTVNTNPVAAPNSKASPSATLKTNMDYDSFLKLFMAQMKNQDPTKPNDPTQTLSQLASFSNVEQSIKLNGKLDSLLSASNATLASALVGKSLSNPDGTISGVAVSIAVDGNGLTATFKDGTTLNLADGYRIGEA